MPHQNQVDPCGALHAVSARGAWMGTRGIIHEGQVVKHRWKTNAWVTCRLDMPGTKRKPFSSNTYTELFFLDEATAFAAGHRPCNDCRPERFKEFKSAWFAANVEQLISRPALIAEVDAGLHRERVQSGDGPKVRLQRKLSELPLGTMVEYLGAVCLLWRGRLRPWSFAGYGSPGAPPGPAQVVDVITPASIVRVFDGGFVPQVHPSAYC